MDRATFDMRLLRKEKTFHIKIRGYFLEEEALKYINEYKKQTSTFNTSDYYLLIDATSLSIVPIRMIEKLKSALHMYAKDNYKSIYIINPKSIVVEHQLKQIIKSCKLKTTFINCYKEFLIYTDYDLNYCI